MKQNEFQEKINSMQEKIGIDSSNLILDDIGILLTDNKEMNKQIDNQTEEIKNYKKTIETLQNINGNLLQQISMGKEQTIENTTEEKKEPFDFRTAFDEKGNFKR